MKLLRIPLNMFIFLLKFSMLRSNTNNIHQNKDLVPLLKVIRMLRDSHSSPFNLKTFYTNAKISFVRLSKYIKVSDHIQINIYVQMRG